MVTYDRKHFVIDGKKVFLYGAECHYFRIDPSHWEDRLKKIKNAGFNLVSTYVPWLWHEPSEGKIDFDGSTHPRRNLVAFLDLCASYGLYCIVRPGPYVMSELKNEGIPNWLLDNYPEVIARTPSGEPHPTRVVSYLHPLYLRLVEQWYSAVSRHVSPYLITHGGSVIMFQLDNEIGMLHWVANTPDANENTKERFEEYVNGLAVRPQTALASHFVFGDFARKEFAVYVRVLKEMAEKNGIDVPFIVNVHGFKDFSVYSRGVDYPIGLSQLREAAQVEDVVLAGDFYPGKIGYDNFHDLLLASALTDAIGKPEQPLFSVEFQSGRLSDRPRIDPSDVDLITRLCVASGMNALNYYMYCGGDNVEGIGLFGRRHEWQAPIGSNGDLRPSYDVTSHLGALFTTYGNLLCDAPKLVDTYIGFYTPYYATETVADTPQLKRIIAEIEAQRELFHFDGLWRLLSAANISYGAVDVLKSVIHEAHVPTLWMATTKYMDRATQQKLVTYMQNGGKLVLGPQIPQYDLAGNRCEVLANAVGASIRDEHRGYQRVSICGIDDVFCRQYNVFDRPADAQTIAFGEMGEQEVLGYLCDVGKGQALVLGVGLAHDYQYQLGVIHRLAELIGVQIRISVTDESVIVTARKGSSGTLLSVMNVDDVVRKTKVIVEGQLAFGGRVVDLAPRSGKLLPVGLQLTDRVVLDYSTVEVTQIHRTNIGVMLELSVPAAHSGALSFTMDENAQIQLPVARDAISKRTGNTTTVCIEASPEAKCLTLYVLHGQHLPVGVGGRS